MAVCVYIPGPQRWQRGYLKGYGQSLDIQARCPLMWVYEGLSHCQTDSGVERERSEPQEKEPGVRGQLSLYHSSAWNSQESQNSTSEASFLSPYKVHLKIEGKDIFYRTLLGWFLSFKYLDILHMGIHLYFCPVPYECYGSTWMVYIFCVHY